MTIEVGEGCGVGAGGGGVSSAFSLCLLLLSNKKNKAASPLASLCSLIVFMPSKNATDLAIRWLK